MKRIAALICAFFVMFSTSVSAVYTCNDVYNSLGKVLTWSENNIKPMDSVNTVASDYYVMALKRSGNVFEYIKYADASLLNQPNSIQDGQRSIMASMAAEKKQSDELVAKYTYNRELKTAADIADAITVITSGEYEIKSSKTDITRMVVTLLEKQDIDGGFDGNISSTAKSIMALSFFKGNCYIVKGENMGEKYRYDVNSAILRGVNYLQNKKNDDFGYGNVKDTSFVIMALDCAGIDADNDPGFSDDGKSTLQWLISHQSENGSFSNDVDLSAISACALVSHIRAMQGNSPFFALLTEDMPLNPNEYDGDINYSGKGLEIATQTEIEVLQKTAEPTEETAPTPYAVTPVEAIDRDIHIIQDKHSKLLPILVIILSIIVIVATATWFVFYMLNIRPTKKYHLKETKDEDG